MERLAEFGNLSLLVGAFAVAIGLGTFLLDSFRWYSAQGSISLHAQSSILGSVATFYLAEGLAIATLLGGLYLLYRSFASAASAQDPLSTSSILRDALSTRRFLRIGVGAALVYGLTYAVVSGIVVYQPNVDFATTYGVTSAGWNAVACCGAWGTVPAAVIYVAPGSHFALELIPLNVLFAFLVPVLVGVNVALAAYSIGRGLKAKWVGSIGAVVGFFTGCPTCAGLFFAGTVGGIGATSIAAALAPFQLVFILVSIPTLLASPFVMAGTVRRSVACRLPRASERGAPVSASSSASSQ
jgi:hypothetical protein